VAEEKLERGKDRIDVPAIGAGLCLHNLFQTGMVIQRDKPIRIWGWAEPGENVSVTFGEKTQSCTAAADRAEVHRKGFSGCADHRLQAAGN
jgi:sialate O-acetylesterase